MNTPVNFELAKLLKEKGFDVKTTGSYVDTTPFSENENDFVEYFFEQNHNEKEHRVSAPTIAKVVMWLYEKYGIWIYSYKIEPFVYDDTPYPKYVWVSMCDKKFINTDNGLAINHHHSPTEAYSVAIEYTLKNLIS